MSDYSTGKIYKIFVDGAEEFCYIGSTIQSLKDRLSRHKVAKDAQYKFASAPFFEEGNNVLIELLEAYPCSSKQELLAKEAEWLLKFPEALNKNTPILDADERHKRRKAICLKNYYEDKERRIQANRAYKEANKEAIKAKRATPEGRAYESEMRKKRMEDPEIREAFNAKRNAIIVCPQCQKEFTKRNLSAHVKSHIIV